MTDRKGGSIVLQNVGIKIGAVEIVAGIDLEIASGEFVCLLGPSGCGKSTLLNAIAGFLGIQSGSIKVNGIAVAGPGPDRGVVFQSSEALFPWLTVLENVEYGPRTRGVEKAQCREAALRYIELVGLRTAADKFPKELSGGMRQRAQLARVLVNEPSIILMDEPFAALDAQTRLIMQVELDRIWRATGATVLFITHDIGEAVLLGNRIITMTAGPRAQFKAVERIEIPHPRDLTSQAAIDIYRTLRDDIGEEVQKALQLQGLA